jgi:cell division control protein 6
LNEQLKILDEIFENFLKGSNIFKQRKALRHDFIPQNLPHREEHIRYLGEILAPTLNGFLCSNVLIYGKTGTGKTAVVKFVLKKISQKSKDIGSFVNFCFINCRLADTKYRIISKLCENISLQVPFTGLAVGEIFDRFKKRLDQKKNILIIVLDEIDSLVRDQGAMLLYELTRVNENLNNSKVAIVGISNNLKFKNLLDPRVLSTLSEEEIVFNPYDADELLDILQERINISFQKGVISESAIRLCSALAAAEHGDARRALDLLRVAGELAERKGEKMILDLHVRQAEKRIEHDRIFDSLKSLPAHSKIVLFGVSLFTKFKIKRSITGDIYNLYCELCEELSINPLTQRRVSGLINELDIIGLLNSRVISLGRYGRTKKISLGVSQKLVKEVFLEDRRFENIVNLKPKYLASK